MFFAARSHGFRVDRPLHLITPIGARAITAIGWAAVFATHPLQGLRPSRGIKSRTSFAKLIRIALAGLS
jgi:hypothetical protein